MRGGSQFAHGRSVRAGLAFFTNRSVRAGAAFPPSGRSAAKSGDTANSGNAALPPKSAAEASARAGSRHGRSMHGGRSLRGTNIGEALATTGMVNVEDGGSGRRGEGAELDNDTCAPDPIATPYAERLQSLLKVFELNQVCSLSAIVTFLHKTA